ncbi:hypothetical protein M4R23_08930 [Acidovorax sp. GBBC 3332]|nr:MULTISPECIES: hypothetical protein [unclassified Acidovorax]MDA8449806.1 hypothetical protein [Acidovorax sp. GBBC 3297]MDA8459251.1 hypothetical protein [Acidovorax sp. GBBC 3333]MDA8464288.1 hypothetical protein [Acidovorax sp. GBBC 3332]MDA8469502.1 hypothetical protein [Acidovorax sp. GBBC 3299]
MSQTTTTPDLTRDEFAEQAHVLAVEIVTQVLKQKNPVRTTVVLAALLQLYRLHAQSLPAEVQQQLSVAVAALAGDLLQAAASTEPVPAGTTTH